MPDLTERTHARSRATPVRRATAADAEGLYALYTAALHGRSELAVTTEELALADVRAMLAAAGDRGLALVVQPAAPGARGRTSTPLVAAAHAGLRQGAHADHRLGPLTVLVHPDHQRRGLGRWLVGAFLAEVNTRMPHVSRVELTTRAANGSLLHLFGELGFVREGLFRAWSRRDGALEDAVPMAWFNPSHVDERPTRIARGSLPRVPSSARSSTR